MVTELGAGETYTEMAILEAYDAYGNRAWLIDNYFYLMDYQLEEQSTDYVQV